MASAEPEIFFLCHDGSNPYADYPEHPWTGHLYRFVKWERSPEDIGDRDRLPIAILRPYEGGEEFRASMVFWGWERVLTTAHAEDITTPNPSDAVLGKAG